MSDLSTANTSSSALPSGLLAGMRSGPASSTYGASSNSAGLSGDAPNFSSVLKERADKLTKPESTPAEKAGKSQEGRESAAAANESSNETANAAAEAASESERIARAEKKNASSTDKKDDAANENAAAYDTITYAPIAALLVQINPAALIAATTDAIESGVMADAKSPFGAMVRELARSLGTGDTSESATPGLALAVGQGESGTDGIPGKLAAPGQAGGEALATDPAALAAAAEGELATPLTVATEGPDLTAIAGAPGDDEAALTTSTLATKGTAGASDFNQLLGQVRDGQSSGLSVSNGGRTGGSEAALAMRSPVGHPNWSTELGDKMTWMVSSQRQQADLVLNPPQLGRIEVSLTVNGDQANAVFTSPNAAVREMLENSLPRLREILAGSGLNLGQADVGAQSFAQQQGQDGQRQASGMRGDIGADIDSAITAGGTVNLGRPGERRGMVDLFA